MMLRRQQVLDNPPYSNGNKEVRLGMVRVYYLKI